MANEIAKRRFDLRTFAPPDIYFTVDDGSEDGQTYRLPGDPDIEVVARMLDLERLLSEKADNSHELAELIVEGKDLILDLLRQRDPSIEDIRLGVGELLTLFGLITGGSTVAASVAAALSDGMARPKDEQDLAGEGGEDGEDLEGVAGGPLRSGRRSSRPSSRSATRTAGRRATGTG